MRKSKRSGSKSDVHKEIITSKKLYDAETGEKIIVSHSSVEHETKRETIARGWTMMYYKDYDNVMLDCVNGKNDLKIFIAIRSLFTRTKSRVNIVPKDIAKEVGCGLTSAKNMIYRLRNKDTQFIARNSDKTYSLNPFIYIPYGANGFELQNEWRIEAEDEHSELTRAHQVTIELQKEMEDCDFTSQNQ